MLKTMIKKLIPRPILLLYHKTLAILANIIYWFPSRKMIVIGVTGTKGKSSTVVMITRILEQAGFKVGSTNTIFFKIADREWQNTTKQGMPGRFKLQKMLRKMVHSKCTHAVIEVTSEGILQSRQWGIAFDVAVFTNLGEEHIEAHGSYEKYRKHKEIIFKDLHKSYCKKTPSLISPLVKGEKVKKIIVANCSDEMSDKFLRHQADEKWAASSSKKCDKAKCEKYKCLTPKEIKQTEHGSVLVFDEHYIDIPLAGKFMAQNALLAIAVARSLNLSLTVCERALEKITSLPGRCEIVVSKKGFRVIIDYAHEPKSFLAIFETAKQMCDTGLPAKASAEARKIIAVFGSPGGGRDISKRPKMGKIASEYADNIILTTDDAYDDDPKQIAEHIMQGINASEKAQIIIDRKQAIKRALEIANQNDLVLLLGKGSEQTMAVRDGKYIPWSDRKIVEENI